MGKLHELLAVEKTLTSAAEKLFTDTSEKFKKADHYFNGHVKTLSMLEENAANKAAEAAARTEKALPTNVVETLDYMLDVWVEAEDILYQKNKTNQTAMADVEFEGTVILKELPVDELMGLESRLTKLRGLMASMPTLDASYEWEKNEQHLGKHVWKIKKDDATTKTEKVMYPVVLAPESQHHPAQVREASKDVVVGLFETKKFSGAASTIQKANVISIIDKLVVEVKKARTRANEKEAVKGKIGGVIKNLIMKGFE